MILINKLIKKLIKITWETTLGIKKKMYPIYSLIDMPDSVTRETSLADWVIHNSKVKIASIKKYDFKISNTK